MTAGPLGGDASPGRSAGTSRSERDAPAEGTPIVRDKRRIDPTTYAVRTPPAQQTEATMTDPQQDPPMEAPGSDSAFGGAVGDAVPGGVQPEAPAPGPRTGATGTTGAADPASGSSPGGDAGGHPDTVLAAERLRDLQRLQAEYVNYKKRVDRDRDLQRELAIAGVIENLLPVLDEIHYARQHGELETGPFAKIAEKLEAILAKYGVERYGQPGETFDPNVHDAVMHTQEELAPGTTDTTVVNVLHPGYKMGDRVIRAAMVAVADPA